MLSLSTIQIETAKKVSINCLQKMIATINSKVNENTQLPMSPSRISLTIESERSSSFSTNSSIDFEFLRKFFQNDFTGEQFTEFHPVLEESGLFNFESIFLLNPQMTPFGWIVSNYFTQVTEHSNYEDWKDQFPLEFDNDIFEISWSGIRSWLSPIPIKLKVVYPIFNVQISGDSFVFDEKRNLKLKIPTNEDKMNLVNDLRIQPSPIEGTFTAMNKLSWVQYVFGLIEGELNLTRSELEIPFGDPNSFPQLNLLHPLHIEEAFALLGVPAATVHCLIMNSPYEYQHISLQPLLDGRAAISRSSSPQYPNWMSKPFLAPPPRHLIELNNKNCFFLQAYPEFRRKLSQDSIESLVITRFFKAARSRIFNEAILDTVIGMESFLTKGSSDASLQFRLNTSWYLGSSFEERKLIESTCNALYGLRSRIVHEGGRKKDIEKIANKLGGIQRTRNIAVDLFCLTIMRAFYVENKSLKFLKREKINNAITAARLGGKLEIPCSLLFEILYNKFLQDYGQEILENN